MKRVYIVGAARSGTTLLNRMLILSGYFADYRAETLLLSVASRRYGKFGKRKEEFLKDWYRSRQFKRSGVDKERFERVYDQSTSYTSLLTSFMDEVAYLQGRRCWADSTPAHINHAEEILKHTPDAYFINIVRDGRDVAVSSHKLGWVGAPPCIKSRIARLVCALHAWERALKAAENIKKAWPNNIITVRYEELVTYPESTIRRVSVFLGVDLSGVAQGEGGLSDLDANTIFPMRDKGVSKEAIGRYKKELSSEEIASLTRVGYAALIESGYEVSVEGSKLSASNNIKWLFFTSYVYLYNNFKSLLLDNGFGRWSSLALEVDKD